MGFNSQAGAVGFKTQTTRGTYKDPGAAAPNNGVYVRLRQGGLGITRDLLIPDAEIGGNRDIPGAELGEVSYTGTYQFYPRMDSLATLLAAAYGASVDTHTGSGATLVGTHVISSRNTLPWLSVEEQVGGGFEVFHYTDCKIDMLKLSVATKGYVEGEATVFGVTQQAGQTPVDPAAQEWDITPMSVSSAVTITWDGVELPAKSFDHTLSNNLEKDDHRLGQFTVGDVTEKRREIVTAVKVRPADSALWRLAAYGSSTATSPQGSPTPGHLILTIETWEVIGTTVTPYSVTIDIPKAIIKPFAVVPANDNVLEEDFEIQAIRPNPATDICTYTVVNDLATIV